VIRCVRIAENEVNLYAFILRIKDYIFQTQELQSRRQQEELSSDLEVSIYDIDRNEKSKIYKILLVRKLNMPILHLFLYRKKNLIKKKIKKILIILLHIWLLLVRRIFHSPLSIYVSQGNPERINREIAEQLRFTVEFDFKNHSIRQANLMQTRYENEIKELITKQSISECEQAKFRLQILDERLKQFVSFNQNLLFPVCF
jgi:hypothetical protein